MPKRYLFLSQNSVSITELFPNSLTTVHSDTVSNTESSAAVLTVVPSAVCNVNGMMYSYMMNGLGRNFHPNWPQFIDW